MNSLSIYSISYKDFFLKGFFLSPIALDKIKNICISIKYFKHNYQIYLWHGLIFLVLLCLPYRYHWAYNWWKTPLFFFFLLIEYTNTWSITRSQKAVAFLGMVEKYILGGHWSCIGGHKLPDGAKGGGGATKNKTNYTITTNTQTSDGANGGGGWMEPKKNVN